MKPRRKLVPITIPPSRDSNNAESDKITDNSNQTSGFKLGNYSKTGRLLFFFGRKYFIT